MRTEKEVIRCSFLPIIANCQGGLHCQTPINPVSAVADAGTEGHALARAYIDGVEVPEPSSAAVRETHDNFKTIWDKLGITGKVETEVEVEYTLDNIIYRGHVDCVANNGRLIIDWKTGRGKGNYLPQLIGYAAGIIVARTDFHDEDIITLAVINPTTDTVKPWKLTVDQVIHKATEYHNLIKSWDGKFHPGEHCTYCPARFSCPGLLDQLSAAVRVSGVVSQLPFLTPEALVELYPQIKATKKILDTAEETIKRLVSGAGGKIEAANGSLWFKQTTRSAVVVNDSADFITSVIGKKTFFNMLSVSLKDLNQAFITWYGTKCPKDKPMATDLPEELKRVKKGIEVPITQEDLKKWVKSNCTLNITTSETLEHEAKTQEQ